VLGRLCNNNNNNNNNNYNYNYNEDDDVDNNKSTNKKICKGDFLGASRHLMTFVNEEIIRVHEGGKFHFSTKETNFPTCVSCLLF
jgi:hypothetical protein